MTPSELNSIMLQSFGEEQLTYASKTLIENLNLDRDTKDLLSFVGLPNGYSLFRFFMNPVSGTEDVQVRECFPEYAEHLYIFGTKLFSPFVLIEYNPENIGLNKNSNIQDIYEKIQELEEDDVYRLYFEDEVIYSLRVCIDTKNNNRIVCLNPVQKEIYFVNTSIQSLALSILAYAKCRSTQEFVDNMLQIDPAAMDDNEKWWKGMTYELEEQFLYMESEGNFPS
jgi:hypothetical protein